MKASLATNMMEWEYSSYKEYCGLRNECLSKVEWGKTILNLSETDFIGMTAIEFTDEEIKNIF